MIAMCEESTVGREGVRSKFSVNVSREKNVVSPKIGPDPDFFNRLLARPMAATKMAAKNAKNTKKRLCRSVASDTLVLDNQKHQRTYQRTSAIHHVRSPQIRPIACR